MPIKHQVVAEMINTGWMFQMTKVVEIMAGAALLANRFVPLALAVAAPVAIMTFLLDAFILDAFVQYFTGAVTWKYLATELLDVIFGGACVLFIHAFLMLAFWNYYSPMMSFRATPAHQLNATTAAGKNAGGKRAALIVLGAPALVLAGINAIWIAGMVNEWLIPWSSLKLLRLQ
ncbi:hypothetical protein CW354_11020 [Marinicaulis flavus]|uniref:Uncharacterized protein n=2 Tax=Hyphococcus luteus TaxID=2058213 RepID=A0A2S7K519_9PROT|nr:hypothetical protein CW354_11020 [Marinicaulis flavus]